MTDLASMTAADLLAAYDHATRQYLDEGRDGTPAGPDVPAYRVFRAELLRRLEQRDGLLGALAQIRERAWRGLTDGGVSWHGLLTQIEADACAALAAAGVNVE